MQNDIRAKLNTELSKPIREESQVVYILSRVRKLLEITQTGNKYRILKFHCDWALHSQIDNVDAMKDILDKIVARPHEHEAVVALGSLDAFDKEFISFLKENTLSAKIYDTAEDVLFFKKLQMQIYSDTPLIVKTVKKTTITLNAIPHDGLSYTWRIAVTPDPE